MKYTIAQFIPIIIIFLLISYFKNVVKFSKTILGKLLAVCIIIFYTFLDKIVGTFVCLLFIFYYQTDIIENMLNIDDLIEIDTIELVTTEDQIDFLDDHVYLSMDEKKNKKIKKEGMMDYVDLYSRDYNKDILLNNEKLQGEFRKENCVNGELINKDIPVKYEMSEHVFPEIRFRRGFCNPCSKNCEFSIIKQKIETENQLIRK